MSIYLVRHAKDDDRYRGGWSDLDLISEGKEQAKKLAEFLYFKQNEHKIARIISSDLAGMLDKEALVKYPGLFFNTLRMDEKYPSGESPDDFYRRVKKWFDDMICKYKYSKENVLIITHGGVINIIGI